MSNFERNSDYALLRNTIRRKDKVRARSLILSNVDVNNPRSKFNTPLHWSITQFKDLEIMEMLLNRGANVHAKNQHNLTPLDVAIQNYKTEATLLLVKKGALFGEDLNALLLKAIEHYNYPLIKILIDNGMQCNSSINLNISLNAAICQGHLRLIKDIKPHCQFSKLSDKYIPREPVIRTGLNYEDCVILLLEWNFTVNPNSSSDSEFVFAAVKRGYLPIVRQLLELGIDANLVDSQTGLNLLKIACIYKHHEVVELLLKHNASVNETTPTNTELLKNFSLNYYNRYVFNLSSSTDNKGDLRGITGLHIAVKNSDPIMTKLLLRYGAKIIDDPRYFNITCIAIQSNCEENVRIFLDHGVDANDIDSQGKALLHFCVNTSAMTESIIKLLLEHNANIEAVDKKGWTPLFEACHSNNNVAVKCLLSHHVNANHTDLENLTPLYIAAKNCRHNSEIVKMLLEHKVNVHCIDKQGKSIIHVIVENRNVELIKSLARTQVNFNSINKEGNTPLHIAIAKRYIKMTETLIKYGANVNILDKKNQTPLCYAILRKQFQDYRVRRDSFSDFSSSSSDFDEDSYDTDCYEGDVNTYKKIIKILKIQVLKVKAAGLKVNKQNLNIVYSPNNYVDYEDPNQPGMDYNIDVLHFEVQCEQEIEKMRTENIGVSTMTLHDLLQKNIHLLSRYVKNKQIQQKLELEVYDEKYPLYIDIVRSRFRDAKLRYRLMNSAKNYFSANICQRLSDDCLDTVFSYLNIKEIKMFIRAMKLLN